LFINNHYLLHNMESLADQLNTTPQISKTEVVEIDTRPDEAIVLESLCIHCEKMGETRMLMTDIPFFKQIVIMSFSCPHCGYKNNEIQPAGQLEDFGVKIELTVNKKEDLERDIVRSNHAVLNIPELQLEIPASGKGYLSTLEGFMTTFKEDLELNQDYRREMSPEVAQQIDDFIRKLDKYIECDEEIMPFTFCVDDPSGHSNIKNLIAPLEDPQLKIEKYVRSIEQIKAMGYEPENAQVEEPKGDKSLSNTPDKEISMNKEENPTVIQKEDLQKTKKHNYSHQETEQLISKMEKLNLENKIKEKKDEIVDAHGMDFNKPLDENIAMRKEMEGEAIQFPTPCPNCFAEGVTRMCTCEIPFFKEIIVMSFTCEKCGARSSEVKTGGGISDQGKKITFYVENAEDMNRDLFKSETAEITINELGLTITTGSLGAVYSTVEGLFLKMIETLRDNNPFMGDSADTEFTNRFNSFIDQLEKYQDGKEKFTLIIDDPLNNSWLMNPFHPEKDRKVTEVVYDRTPEQDIELGINFLKEAEANEGLKVDPKEID